MIKHIAMGVWVCALTLGAGYFASANQAKRDGGHESDVVLGGLDFVKPEIVSVPIIRSGEIQGYAVAQFVYTAEHNKIKKLMPKVSLLLRDVAFRTLYVERSFDFRKFEVAELSGVTESIRSGVNDLLGEPLVHQVLVDKLTFAERRHARARKLSSQN